MKTLEKIFDFISKVLFGSKSVMPWVLLLMITTANAQIRFADKEYQTFSVAIDPAGSIKEGGLDIRNTCNILHCNNRNKKTKQIAWLPS